MKLHNKKFGYSYNLAISLMITALTVITAIVVVLFKFPDKPTDDPVSVASSSLLQVEDEPTVRSHNGDTMAVSGTPSPGLASLAELLPALEVKAAADPSDIGRQLLLAQTYAELGQLDRGITLLNKLRQDGADHEQLVFVLATLLMRSERKGDRQQAFDLFGGSASTNPKTAYLARLYQGQILRKQGNDEGAHKIWRAALDRLPAGDPRRLQFQDEIDSTNTHRESPN